MPDAVSSLATVPTALGEPVEIGVGGVMTRYDERTDFYGNQHKHGLIETPAGFIWIDRKNRALINMNLGGETAELSAMKGMMSFFDPLIKHTTEDNPIDKLSNGVLGVYDARTKNTYISFVGKNSVPVEGTVAFFDTQLIAFNLGSLPDSVESILGNVQNGDTVFATHNEVTYQATSFGTPGQFLSTDIFASIYLVIPGLAIGDIVSLVFYSDIDSQTISFNHLNSQFISRYSFKPSMYMRYNDFMFSIPHINQGSRKEVYIHDEGDLAEFYNTVYELGI